MSNSWKPDTFTITKVDENIKSGKFIVPRFQRGVVWTDDQKQDLVDTIKRGLPFGSILLYEGSDGNYQIIDGLQRSRALIEFRNNPTQFFSEDDIDLFIIREIYLRLGVTSSRVAIEEKLSKMVVEWIRSNYKTIDDVERIQFAEFGQIVSNEWPTSKGKEFEIGGLIQPMLESFQAICRQINATEVPAIILSGDSDQLSTLFERINSKGTQLSKYDIFAASWSNDKFNLDNSDLAKAIVKYNKNRYDSYLDGELQLDDYDSMSFINTRELNAFEIAFGFGKYLCEKWPHLFGDSKDDKEVESIGFTLLNVCIGVKNNAAKDFNVFLRERIDDKINDYLRCVIEAVEITDGAIGKYSKFKLNSREKSKNAPLHTEFQISSIIASVFLSKRAEITYDDDETVRAIKFDLDRNASWKQGSKEKFQKNVGKIYLSDIISKRWSGTGDKKLDDIIRQPQFYMREIKEEDFSNRLDVWFNSLSNERSEYKKVSNVKTPEKAILAAIYLKRFSVQQQLDNSHYDIEHLAPINLMKKHLDRFDGNLRLPISSIGNLCLLPEYANRSKGDSTLYQDKQYLEKATMSLDEIETVFSFTKSSDLKWIEDEGMPEDEFERNYFEFITNHFAKMKKIIMQNYASL